MELILALATVLELMVVGVLVVALWQDHRSGSVRKQWQEDMRTLTQGEELNALTRW
jgi:hypothetical protein